MTEFEFSRTECPSCGQMFNGQPGWKCLSCIFKQMVAAHETERKLLSTGPCGQMLCEHGKRVSEDCIHCLDLEEQKRIDAEGWPSEWAFGIKCFTGGRR